ncbi:MAG: deoxyribodipyrimidine photo-lyase [Flavobacteriales bacterium]|nr:deoxyribodipyrimidine photo-lyase [Flavobacteriales bacterium]
MLATDRFPKSPSVAIHWFRRDLRLHDNHGLCRSLKDHGRVLPLSSSTRPC